MSDKPKKSPDKFLRDIIERSKKQYKQDKRKKRMRDPALGSKLL